MSEVIANSPIPGVPAPISSLAAPITDSVTSALVLKSAAPISLQGGQFRILIGSEILLVTGGQNTNDWTAERGVEGSHPSTHLVGAPVYHVWTAAGLGSALGTEGALLAADNLSDLPNIASARINLGLGTAATQPSSAFDASGTSAAETVRAEAAEALLAPLASPVLSGSPTAPTRSSSDNSTNIATTAFVQEVTAALSAGLVVHSAVQWATSASLPPNTYASGGTLTAVSNGALSVDGNALSTNDRVVIKNETTAANNGIYSVTNPGASGTTYVLTRATDMNTGVQVPGAYAFVIGGTANAGAGYTVQGAGPYTIGTTAINWTQFSTTGSINPGTALTKAGNTLNVVLGTSGSSAAAGNDSRITGALQAANNLSDVGSVSAVRTNLGLGTAATQSTSAFDAAGTSASETTRAETAEALLLVKANNLSDVGSAASARGNLGLGSAALQSTSAFDAAGTSTAETTRAEAAEALLAPLASPTFTGTPRAPTVSPSSDNSTKIATTAFVQSVTLSGSLPTGTQGQSLILPAGGSTSAQFANCIIDARAYGVKADNSTDDTLAIQAALNAAVVAVAGLSGNDLPAAIVQLPAGRMIVGTGAVTSPIIGLVGNVMLRGHGPSASYLVSRSTTLDVVGLKTGNEVQCQVRELGIIGSNATPSGGNGINLTNSGDVSILGDTRHVIDNVVIVATYEGVTMGAGGTENRINQVTCQRVIQDAFDITATDSFISNCTAGQPGRHGFYLQGGNTRMWGCKVYGGGNGGSSRAFLIAGAGRHQITAVEAQDVNGVAYEIGGANCSLTAALADSCALQGFIIDAVGAGGGTTLQGWCLKRGGGTYTPTIGGDFENVAGCHIDLSVSGATQNIKVTAGTQWTQSYLNINNSRGTQAVSYGATVTPDPYVGGTVIIGTITGNLTLANPSTTGGTDPSNFFPNQPLTFILPVDATGGYTLAFGASYSIPHPPTLTASSHNVLQLYWDAESGLWRQVVAPGLGTAAFVSAPSSTIVGISDTQTLTNKRITKRVVTVTQSATPTINTDNTDVASITGLAQAITSMSTNLTGTPVAGDTLIIEITDNGTARAITWGSSFAATNAGPTLPTTTVLSDILTVGFRRNAANSVWSCVAVA